MSRPLFEEWVDFPVFVVREGAGPLTPEMVAQAAEES
jgi:hypothetical protein